MVVLLEESEDVREDLLFSILSILGHNKTVSTLLPFTILVVLLD